MTGHVRHINQNLLIHITRQLGHRTQPLRPRLAHDGAGRPVLGLVERRDLVEVDVLVEGELQGRGDVVRVVVLGVVVRVVVAAVGVGVFVVAVVGHFSCLFCSFLVGIYVWFVGVCSPGRL